MLVGSSLPFLPSRHGNVFGLQLYGNIEIEVDLEGVGMSPLSQHQRLPNYRNTMQCLEKNSGIGSKVFGWCLPF